MMRSRSPFSSEVQALVERERAIAAQPASVRARVLARARAALRAGEVRPPALSAPPSRATRVRWVAAAALVFVATAAVGAAAYEIRARLVRVSSDHPAAPPAAPPARVTATPAAPPAAAAPAAPVDIARSAPTRASAAPRAVPPAEAVRAELRLLRQARAAVAREDFAAALAPLAEHARRFENGRLVEEREALRVKALAGLGRTQEARHAAAAFRTRFPRSVLLPAVSRMPAAEP